MDVSRIRALRGPNIWGKKTAVEALVTLDETEQYWDRIPELRTTLIQWLPSFADTLQTHKPDTLAHVLTLLTHTLQQQAGCPVSFWQTSATSEQGVYVLVAEYSEEQVGREALALAEKIIEAARQGQTVDVRAALAALTELDEDIRLGPSTGSIVDAALAQGVPYRRLTEGSMVQFGWGSKQRRILAAETDATSAIAESIAQDKDLTKMLLEAAGVPVPNGYVVEDAQAAWKAAQDIGGAVVVKPRDGNQGKGVAVNLSTQAQIEEAFAVASDISSEVIVERYVPGVDYRLLVVGKTLVAAARRDPAHVIGDGDRTIEQLIEEVNKDPLRGDGHATPLTKIRIDDIALATLDKQNLAPTSIPALGQKVLLRDNANLSTGGTATDVTDEVHPELAARAVAAAQMVGLDICGVDLVCESVSKSMEEQGGGIVEVNAAPGLRMHLAPSYGKARPVGEAIISMMFPDNQTGRIPVVAVTGTNGKTTTIRLITHILSRSGLRVGMTNSDGVYIKGARIDAGDCSGPRSARSVLLHPYVDAAVLETARGGILREGLGFDRCDVAVVTNIGIGDHLGINHINTVEELAKVKRVIVENVSPTGNAVLNAMDPQTVAMADHCPGGVIFFSADKACDIIQKERGAGRKVVYLDGNAVVAVEGFSETRIELSDVPLTRNGTITFQIENVMAATAAVWSLGLDWETIRAGLATFVNDAQTAPGRFNVFDYKGATVIADYGHNPDAIIALVGAIERMPAKRRLVVISGAGDRRDEDISEQTRILGSVFDDVILYEDACQRGRSEGEVVALLREGLVGATRARLVDEIKGEFNAFDRAFELLQPGDLCLLLIDQVDAALDYISKTVANAA